MPRPPDLRTTALPPASAPASPQTPTHTQDAPALARTRSFNRPAGFPDLPPARPAQAKAVSDGSRPASPVAAGVPAQPVINPQNAAVAPRRPLNELPPIPANVPADVALVRTPTVTTQATHHGTLQPMDIESLNEPAHSEEASTAMYMLMQVLRHIGPVGGSRTLIQGLAGPALAHAVEASPNTAIAVQSSLSVYSLARRMMSQIHTEAAGGMANAAFLGDVNQAGNSAPRQRWQALQTAGILAGDVTALALTVCSKARPELMPLAQTMASIQVRAHALAQSREFLRPTINTVHVGSSNAPRPPDGRNLRPQDINWGTSLRYGGAVAVVEVVAQLLMQATLGGKAAWQAGKGLAMGAGVIAGVANTLTSSTEDVLVDQAAARRMQETDPAHVVHLHWDAKNPLTRNELGRQFERVDTRVFNQMLPAMIVAGVMHGISQALPQHAPELGKQALGAAASGVINAVMLGGLLALTTQSYQMNDAARSRY